MHNLCKRRASGLAALRAAVQRTEQPIYALKWCVIKTHSAQCTTKVLILIAVLGHERYSPQLLC